MKFTIKSAKAAGFESKRAAIRHSIKKYEYLSTITNKQFEQFNEDNLRSKCCALCWRYLHSDKDCSTGKKLLGCPLASVLCCSADDCAGSDWCEMSSTASVEIFRKYASNILAKLKKALK